MYTAMGWNQTMVELWLSSNLFSECWILKQSVFENVHSFRKVFIDRPFQVFNIQINTTLQQAKLCMSFITEEHQSMKLKFYISEYDSNPDCPIKECWLHCGSVSKIINPL